MLEKYIKIIYLNESTSGNVFPLLSDVWVLETETEVEVETER